MIYTYHNIKDLLNNPQKTKFIYNGVEYSVFPATKDNTLLIKSFELGTPTIKLTTFLYQIEKELGLPHDTKKQAKAPKVETAPKIDPLTYTVKLSEPKELSKGFLETMQLSNIFLEDYKTHKNIAIYDNKHEVLYFQHKDNLNLRYKI